MFRFKGIGSLLNRSGSIQPAWRHLLRRNTTSEAIPLPSRFSLLRQKLMEEGNGARKAVGYWMLGSGSLVFGLVVLGGLTRLTESGLSMVDWKLIHFQAPRNDEEWAAYFEKYKQFPEYQLYPFTFVKLSNCFFCIREEITVE